MTDTDTGTEITAIEKAGPRPSVAARVANLLAEEGYRPRVEEGDKGYRTVLFKAEGQAFVVRLNEGDPTFLAVCLGYRIDPEEGDEQAALRAGHDVQAALKVVKFYLGPDRTFYEFAAELWVDEQPLSPAILERCISTLRRACSDFRDRLREESPRAKA